MIKLYQGDCIEIMNNIPDKSIDMILCDLPYGTTSNQWDEIIPFDKLWNQYKRIIKDDGAIVLFSQMPFTAKLAMSNIEWFKYEWIWQKEAPTGHLNAKKMPLKLHENILVFYKNLPTYNPQMKYGKEKYVSITRASQSSSNYRQFTRDVISTSNGERYPKDIIKCKRDSNKLHPTQKPVPLLKYLIKTYTNTNDTVLDNCMGSGSTGVACKQLDRNFIGIELEKKYYEIAKERIGD